MFQYLLPFIQSAKVLLKYVLLSGSLFVSLSIWVYSADVYLPVNNGLHYHKHCQMPSDTQGLFYFPSYSMRIFVQIKHCYDFSVPGQTAKTLLWVIAAAEAFYVSQFSFQ